MIEYVVIFALIGTLLGLADRSLIRLNKPITDLKSYAMELVYNRMMMWFTLLFIALAGALVGIRDINNLLGW